MEQITAAASQGASHWQRPAATSKGLMIAPLVSMTSASAASRFSMSTKDRLSIILAQSELNGELQLTQRKSFYLDQSLNSKLRLNAVFHLTSTFLTSQFDPGSGIKMFHGGLKWSCGSMCHCGITLVCWLLPHQVPDSIAACRAVGCEQR